jgi:adenylate cyclase
LPDAAEPFDRRRACTLSIDVVGYSRMLAKNDRAAVHALRGCRAIINTNIAQNNGRMFTTAGDGFLIEFLSSIDAAKCLIAVQNGIREYNSTRESKDHIWLRSGIEIGNVIDDDGDLHGDSVNIAVRLQEACPAGGGLISGDVYSDIAKEIDATITSIGVMHFKNIAQNVCAYEIEISGADIFDPGSPQYDIDLSAPVSRFGNRAAVAILPLANVTKESKFDHIAEGFSDSLIVAVSHMRQFPVIDKNSSFLYRDQIHDAHSIGEKLGARYLVSGELLEFTGKVRLSLRLTETTSAHTLWSDTYILDVSKIFTALEDVGHKVAATIEGRLERAEETRARTARLSRIDTISLVWRGRWHINKLTRKDSQQAKHLLDLALKQDPDHPEALIQLGYWHWLYCWTQRRPPEDILAFKEIAFRALNANELDSRGHFLMGCAEILLKSPATALEHYFDALRLNPSSAHSLMQTGSCYMLLGQLDAAVESLENSIRLNPQDYYLFAAYGELACSYSMMGQWKKSISFARRSLSLRPYYWHARMTEITALSNMGEKHDSARALQALLARRPDFLNSPYIDWLPFADKKWNRFFNDGIACASSLVSELPAPRVMTT